MAGRNRVELYGSGPEIEFARRLRGLRDRHGITLRVLAEKSGYSQASLSAAEGGRRLPSWDLVTAFVQSCGDDPRPWREQWELARQPPAVARAQPGMQPDTLAQLAAWKQAEVQIRPQPQPALEDGIDDPPAAPAAPSPPRPPWRRSRLPLASLFGAAVIGGLSWVLFGSAFGTDAPLPERAGDTVGCVGADAPRSVLLDPNGDPRQAGWFSSRPTPWDAPQCQNQIWWAPYLNAGANPARHFSWTFAAPDGGTSACSLWAYFPPPPAGHLGGTAHYAIQDGADASAPRLAYLAVAQADHMGTWYPLGSYTIESGYIRITLDNSASDPNPQHGPMAGPVHAACR